MLGPRLGVPAHLRAAVQTSTCINMCHSELSQGPPSTASGQLVSSQKPWCEDHLLVLPAQLSGHPGLVLAWRPPRSYSAAPLTCERSGFQSSPWMVVHSDMGFCDCVHPVPKW